MPRFLAKQVAGSHPRGHVYRLNVVVWSDSRQRWMTTSAAFEKDKPNCLIHNDWANHLGLPSGTFIKARVRLVEAYRSKGTEQTTDIPIDLKREDDAGLSNYQTGFGKVNLVLGKPFHDLLKDVHFHKGDYVLEIDGVRIRCTPAPLPGVGSPVGP